MAIPILSRLSFRDYMKLVLTFAILLIEQVFRCILLLVPYPLLDWVRYRVIGYAPRIFRGYRDEAGHPISQLTDTMQMIEYHGYPSEEHTAMTQDGYFLVLHRIPSGRRYDSCESSRSVRSGTPSPTGHDRLSPQSIHSANHSEFLLNGQATPGSTQETIARQQHKPIVFLMHGCMMNSEAWVCPPDRTKSYAFVLADLGYDVWMGNFRGNKYSHKHRTLRPSEKEFWNFCLDELAFYDIPCMIQYILHVTGESRLSYMGFSQGTMTAFAALAVNKDLESKLNTFIALAATTVPKGSTCSEGRTVALACCLGLENGIASSLIRSSPDLMYLIFGRASFLSVAIFWRDILSPRAYSYLIDSAMKYLFNWRCSNMARVDKDILYYHLYSFTSVKLIVHWFQIICSLRLQMYDDGSNGVVNMLSTGNHLAPRYHLSKIKTPVLAFYGERDSLTDITYSIRESPRVSFESIVVPHYEHLDFLWAYDTDKTILPHVIAHLTKTRNISHANSALSLPSYSATPVDSVFLN